MIEREVLQKEVLALWSKKTLPSTIGHYLRDKYNVKVNKLCRQFPFLKQSLEVQYLRIRISTIRDHVKKNHKDYVSKRNLKKKLSKYYNLSKYYGSSK